MCPQFDDWPGCQYFPQCPPFVMHVKASNMEIDNMDESSGEPNGSSMNGEEVESYQDEDLL
jgi:hypothetical protein